MENIAVLITVHNRKEKTLRCLSNLFSQQGLESLFRLEVFLVDDASTDGTSQAIRELFSNVNILEGDGTLYWNRGMHLAWDVASNKQDFDYYLWLNDDTVLFENAIVEMLNLSYKSKNEYFLVCGAVCSNINGEFTYGGYDASGNRLIPKSNIQECYIINGNCVLINKTIFQKVGNLDSTFPHAIGDHDYGLRAINKGVQIVTSTTYVGTCERNTSLPQWCYSKVPLYKRLENLYSPLGNAHPLYFFIFEKRHFGLFRALKHFCSIHLRVLFPQLWNK